MSEQTPSVPRLVAVYMALLCLLAITAGSTILPTGWWSTAIGLLIASAKAFLIAYYFMNLRAQKGLVRVVAVAGPFWLLVMVVLTASDYLNRSWPG